MHDDGKGYHPSDSGGLGIRIMRYRAEMIGGHFDIFRTEHGGTTVICRVSDPPQADAGDSLKENATE